MNTALFYRWSSWPAVVWMAFCVLAGWPGFAAGEEDWTQHLLVVANKRVPESVELAQYYMERRGIATNRVFLLDCPQKPEITREEYNETLRKPMEQHLQSRGWLERDSTGATLRNDCWLLVLCWGVPLKIAADPALKEPVSERLPPQFRRNEAAVDSELAALPLRNVSLTGPLNNQFFRMELFPAFSRRVMLVARLDGPNVAVARALVDRAIAVETTGLLGRGYFDCRGTKEPGYLTADQRLRAAWQAARRAGVECVLDENEAVFPASFPMTDVGLYAGWYAGELAGALARPGFQFRPGAIAYHIHSFSATFMVGGWVGPCLARGAGASVGNVYEPYLGLVLDPQILFERLLAGKNFVESAYAATPALSWQQTVVGDPLYRPFLFSADEQIQRMEAAQHPQRAWAYLRKANLMIADGKEPETIRFLNDKNAALRSPILDEKLGDLYRQFRLWEPAVGAYQRAAVAYADPYDVIRVSTSLMAVLQQMKRTADTLTVLDGLIRKYTTYEGRAALLEEAIRLAGQVGDGRKLDYYTRLITEGGTAKEAGEKKK